jgi:hypothetical protein
MPVPKSLALATALTLELTTFAGAASRARRAQPRTKSPVMLWLSRGTALVGTRLGPTEAAAAPNNQHLAAFPGIRRSVGRVHFR